MKYEEKDQSYYANVRSDLLSILPKSYNGIHVLEIGAGNGSTLAYLKKKGVANWVVGIDIPESKRESISELIDEFIYGDIEELDIDRLENSFDCVILADVLEHLVFPDKVLNKVQHILKKNGIVLVSMPNVRHFQTFKNIYLKGDFAYEESGLFDFTHLRFYCKKNIEDLLTLNGFEIQKTLSALRVYEGKSIAKLINKLTFGLIEEFLTVQYFIRANIKN